MLSSASLFTLIPVAVGAATLSKRSINGPVITGNFADPSLLTANGTYYVFSTNHGGKNIPAQMSTDFVNWTPLPDALPTVGSWSNGNEVFAPDVIQISEHSGVNVIGGSDA